jgi:hypothetical protein
MQEAVALAELRELSGCSMKTAHQSHLEISQEEVVVLQSQRIEDVELHLRSTLDRFTSL